MWTLFVIIIIIIINYRLGVIKQLNDLLPRYSHPIFTAEQPVAAGRGAMLIQDVKIILRLEDQ